jgi:murein DD-endopeptidase MepM/ murein hydrolase activator NlpD
MTFKFVSQPLLSGRYEPEGIYLHGPLAGRYPVVQRWGEHPTFYAQYTYHGVALKGHVGLDLAAPVGIAVLAVDQGRVVELNEEPQGFGRYLKIEHAWGESLYAHLEELLVDAGQSVARGARIALSGDQQGQLQPHLHLGIRIKPFHRFDGWGGFTDPLPFLSEGDIEVPEVHEEGESNRFPPPPMAIERPGMRRP